MNFSAMRFRAPIRPAGLCPDEVHWLARGELRKNAPRGFGFRSRALRFSAAICAGVAMNVSSSGIAFAPAVAHTAAEPLRAIELPSVLPVERAPIEIGGELGAMLFADFGDDDDDDGEPILPAVEVVARAPIPITAEGAPILAALRAHASPVSLPAALDVLQLRPTLDTSGSAAVAQPDDSADQGRDPNELVQFGAMRIPRGVVEMIVRAAAVTDVDPVYMMALADKESSFSTDVRARTSSAEGLFQFVTKTWLSVVRTFGAKHGLADEAAAIELVDGQPTIKDDATRERVLGLRRDPYLSAVMAAEMMKRDRAAIERRIGRDLNRSEFYLAHFLGAQGAGKLMALVDEKPKQSAPRVFREAAKANRTLFFARQGKRMKDLTVAQVYDKLDQMIDHRISRYSEVTRVITVSDIDTRSPL
jgi:hypothetical protein